MDYEKLIRENPLFSGAEPEEWGKAFPELAIRILTVQTGDHIFLEDDEAKCMYVVMEGRVQISQTDREGNLSVLTMAEPGDLFAETFLCLELKQYPVGAVTTERSVLMEIPQSALTGETHMLGYLLCRNLMKILARKNLIMNQKIRCMSRKTTGEKLLTYLYLEGEKRGSRHFTIPFDRQGLADYLGVERSAMCAELSKLKKQRRIDYHKNEFTLLEVKE